MSTNREFRTLLASTTVLLTMPACNGPSLSRGARPADPAQSTTATTEAPPATTFVAPKAQDGTEATEPEPPPDGWKRYLLDDNRFSALFPASPKATMVGQGVAYEARNPAGALYTVACSPAADDHGLERARIRATRFGHVISDGDAYFFDTEAYLAHVRLSDQSERVILFVEYGGRDCTVTAEVTSNDETSMHFVESFRREPRRR